MADYVPPVQHSPPALVAKFEAPPLCPCGPTCACTDCRCGTSIASPPAKRYATVRVQVCDGNTCHWEDRQVEIFEAAPPPALVADAKAQGFPLPMPGSETTPVVKSGRFQPVRQILTAVRDRVASMPWMARRTAVTK